MNRLNKLFQEKSKDILSVFFTAGHPNLNDTVTIIENLDKAGADIVEVGIPFSDPVADGQVIQQSSLKALNNGMSVKLLFEQLKNIRSVTQMPIILMGYLNPVIQYGITDFCKRCYEIGIDGLILPDLPPELYIERYKDIFEMYKLANIMLVTPQTSDERIKQLDKLSSGFLYVVSSSSTTGAKTGFQEYQLDYFKRLKNLNLTKPKLIGFGISDNQAFKEACLYAEGVIIGSAFIRKLEQSGSLTDNIIAFIKTILESN